MPRIPAALAIVATFAACIGFNVTRYPEVREMAASCGPTLKFSGSKEPAETEQPASSNSPAKASPSPKPAVAYCTLDGVCYGPDGKPVSSKAVAPGKAQSGPKYGSSAASTEPPLVPIVRTVSVPTRPGGTVTATASSGTAPGPIPGTAKSKKIERLPPPDPIITTPAVSEPDPPMDSIPIYPNTQVRSDILT